ncbi:MAG: cytidylyltransferase domain-containing protein [Akkermansiaceae bacterium]
MHKKDKKYTVAALIGVRGGSQRVEKKNSRSFSSSNLLRIKIQQLLEVPNLDKVVVNSEDEALLELAKDSGAEIVKRDPAFATDGVSTSDYYRNIAENCDADVILSATVTTPLMKVETYEKGIEKFFELEGAGFDSVTSCTTLKEFLYVDGKPLNYDPSNQVRSQDLPNIFVLNYGYSILFRENMIKNKNIVGKSPCFVPISKIESVDIDTLEDFFIAETLYNAVNKIGKS